MEFVWTVLCHQILRQILESEQTFTLTGVVSDYTISPYLLQCILDQSFPLRLWVLVEAKQSEVALGCAPHSPQPIRQKKQPQLMCIVPLKYVELKSLLK